MALCCGGSSGCRCVVEAEADDSCNPVGTTVTGAGSALVPYVIGTTWDPTRAFRLDGNEPWTLVNDGGCTIVAPRCQYGTPDFQFMCDVSGTLVGYALLPLDCETGVSAPLFQALDTTTTSSSLPSGWNTCCTEANVGGFAPMYTDGADLDTFVGYVFIRYDNETGTYQQRYVTTSGTETSTKPSGWEHGECSGSGGSSEDAELTITEHYITASIQMVTVATGNYTWTDMPAAEDFFDGTPRHSTKFDLTDWEEARIVVRKAGTAGATNAKLIAQYSTVSPGTTFVAGDWSDLGNSEISVAINVTNTTLASSWVSLPSGAKADVYLAVIGSGGDGAADPIFGAMSIQVRRQVVTDVEITGGGGGGGGGSGPATGSLPLRVNANGVLDDTRYPDHGIPGLSNSDRVYVARIHPDFTTGTFERMTVTLYNVTAAPSENVVLVLKNITDTVDVGTVTIASGTSPTSNMIITEANISGTFADEEVFQWHISNAPAGNAYALHADAFYTLT